LSRHLGWRAFGVLAVIGAAVALRVSRPNRLALNLWGGTQVVLESQATDTQQVDADTVTRTQDVLRRRVDQLFTTTDGGHVKRVPAAIGACILLVGSACSDVSFIDEVTIVNDTEYPAHVDVTDGTGDAWMGLTSVDPQSTKTVEEVIDQGEMWVFRFDYVGKSQEEVKVSRRELEQDGWTIDVPSSFEQGLRDLDVLPP
jgi:hypothetical protein